MWGLGLRASAGERRLVSMRWNDRARMVARIRCVLVLLLLAPGAALLGSGNAGASVHGGSTDVHVRAAGVRSVRISSHPRSGTVSSTATFAFSAKGRASFSCSLDGRPYTVCRSPKTYRQISVGSHVFAVRASVNGLRGASASYRWSVVAPVPPTIQFDLHPPTSSGSTDADFTFSSSNDNGFSFECSLDGAPYSTCTSAGLISYALLAEGDHSFSVRVVGHGDVSYPATTFRWVVASGGDVGSAPVAIDAATSVGMVEQALRSFFAQYNMTVAITNIQPSFSALLYATWTPIRETDLNALKAYAVTLVDEWSKYPRDYIRAIRVGGVVLVNNLFVSGGPRAGMPDWGGNVMYYDIENGRNDEYARLIIHHELDHLLTYNLFGTFTPSDPGWMALNPPGFNYGNGGAACNADPTVCPHGQHVVTGFVSGYATSAIEEDKAETYGYLMETTYYKQVQTWIASDTALAAKVANDKAFLCGLASSMCGSYFASINGG